MVACPNIAAGTEVSWSSVLMNLPGWSKINTQFRKTQPALAYRSHRYCWIGACHPEVERVWEKSCLGMCRERACFQTRKEHLSISFFGALKSQDCSHKNLEWRVISLQTDRHPLLSAFFVTSNPKEAGTQNLIAFGTTDEHGQQHHCQWATDNSATSWQP